MEVVRSGMLGGSCSAFLDWEIGNIIQAKFWVENFHAFCRLEQGHKTFLPRSMSASCDTSCDLTWTVLHVDAAHCSPSPLSPPVRNS